MGSWSSKRVSVSRSVPNMVRGAGGVGGGTTTADRRREPLTGVGVDGVGRLGVEEGMRRAAAFGGVVAAVAASAAGLSQGEGRE